LNLAAGGKVTVVDNDVMPHTLIQVSGPKASLTGAAMKHMGAAAKIAFPVKGTYVFKTRAGEDYMKGIKTIGADNVLKLVVKVA
jgi:plastocyanin